MMGWCTARCKMLLFHAKTIMGDCGDAELARLKKERKKERKKEKEEKQVARFMSTWCGTFATVFRGARSLVGHENTQR